ncbi:MAG TPA: TIGR02266 family protein [bacterium]|nr:TIGR02266 family protein [bacterium]
MTDDITKRDRDDVIFDKRRDTRIGAEFTVSFELAAEGPHKFFTGITQDISKGGIFLSTLQTLPIGTKMKIAFAVEGRNINAQAEVRWVRGPEASDSMGVTPGMGLRFVDIAEEDRVYIDAYVKEKETIYYDDEEK